MNSHIPCQRELFDIPDGIHYLNCAYISPLLKAAKNAAQTGLVRESHPWDIVAADFFEPIDELRGLFARLIGATADDIAIVPAASYGIATAAKNLPLSKGQNIITLELQYPSNVYVWRDLAKRTGANLRIVIKPDNGDWTAAILANLDQDTAIAALPNNHWMDGAKLDLVQVSRRLRDIGAGLVLDTSQSSGAMPLNVADIQPDFLTSAGYKWMMGPYGLSFLYAAPKWHRGNPLEFSAHNMKDGDDFPRLAQLKDEYALGARRYDAGERAHFTLAPAAIAALRQLLEWGVDNIYRTLSSTTADISNFAREFDLATLPDDLRAGHFIGLRFPQDRYPEGPPDKLYQCLHANRVFVSLRGDALRITPHLYNNEEDIEQLKQCLRKTL